MILQVLRKIGFRFFIANWVPREPSAELKTKRVEIYRKILDVLGELDSRQKNHVIKGDKCYIYWDGHHCG
jgi:hypothetical protein